MIFDGKEADIILASELFGALWKEKDVEITGISDDSQRIAPGEIFVCRKGAEADGCDYIDEAAKRGAAAVVSYRSAPSTVPLIETADIAATFAYLAGKLYLPKRHFKLVGVTGTNGKTTVTHIIRDILEGCGKRVGIIGTNGIFFGEEKLDIVTSTPTTPGTAELWKIFSEFERSAADFVIMEVSSHAVALGRVAGCRFDVGVFTNLTRDHLDFHGGMREYAAAKKELFKNCDSAVINIDDRTGVQIYSDFCGRKLSVGFSEAELSAAGLRCRGGGSEFFAEYGGETVGTSLALPGRFNVYNALLAVGACVLSGIDFKKAAQTLPYAKPVRGRMERVPGTECVVIIDYAHTPDGLEKVIHTVKGFARGRVITLFGCGGDRDKTKRPIMGEIAGRYSDYTVLTSDNPRTEDPFSIIGDIYAGMAKTDGKYCIVPDRRAAIFHALSLAEPEDVVLIAGKGQEEYQIIGKEKLPFNEREIIGEYIKNTEDKGE